MMENYHLCTCSITAKLQAEKNYEKKPCLYNRYFSGLKGRLVEGNIKNNEPGSFLT